MDTLYGRIFVDNVGGIFVDIVWVNLCGHCLGEFSWTLKANSRGHLFDEFSWTLFGRILVDTMGEFSWT